MHLLGVNLQIDTSMQCSSCARGPRHVRATCFLGMLKLLIAFHEPASPRENDCATSINFIKPAHFQLERSRTEREGCATA